MYKKPLINFIDQTPTLKEKFQILDHHKSEIDEGNANFSFSKIQVSDKNGKCSGTSLFYEYLLNNNYIKQNSSIDLFVELTRQYDTWEWKTKYNNEFANDLNIAFILLGRDSYVQSMCEKLSNNAEIIDLELNENINEYKEKMLKTCKEYIKTMYTVKLNGFLIGVITSVEDRYKNDIAEMLKTEDSNIDFVALVLKDRDTISFRSVASSIDVGKFASLYGGKGHKEAGSCLQANKILKDLEVMNNTKL